MTDNDKERLKKQTQKRYLLLRIKNGYDFVRINRGDILFWRFMLLL